MTLIVMMRSLSVIRVDRWLLSAVRSDKCGNEIELILCCYRNAIYARYDGKDGCTKSHATKQYYLISAMKTARRNERPPSAF